MQPAALGEAKALLERGERLVVTNLPGGDVAFHLQGDGRAVGPSIAKALLLGRWPKTNAPMTGRLVQAEDGPLAHGPGTTQIWKWQLRHDESPAARRKHRQAKMAARAKRGGAL